MGLGEFLKKKGIERREQKAIEKRMDVSIKREEEQARFEGRRKGTIERARKEAYQKAKSGGRGITFVNPFEMGGGGLGEFAPFTSGGFAPGRESPAHHRKSKGTTINVNGTRITVHARQRNKTKHKRRKATYFF